MIVGHRGVIEALRSHLPPVSIITGPPSVGKRLIAAQAAMNNNIARIDFTEVSHLTVDEARRVKDFMATHPISDYKFALIDLDTASTHAMDKLLKSLEEPPRYARFSLISSTRLPDTILTRGQKFTVGLLSHDELYEILTRKGVPEKDAVKLCKLGQVDVALHEYQQLTARTIALNVLDAAESSDYILFMQAYKAVDDNVARAILTALQESASRCWKLYDPQYLGVFSERKVALAVLAAWGNVSYARPKLAVRAALESLMRG